MRDVLVNKTILYKNTKVLLTEIFDNVQWAVRWTDDILAMTWIDPDIIKKAESIKHDCKKAMDQMQRVYTILEEFKNMPNKTKVNVEFKRLECVTVIKGGLYVEPVKKVPVEVLSGEAIRFFDENKNKETSPGTQPR